MSTYNNPIGISVCYQYTHILKYMDKDFISDLKLYIDSNVIQYVGTMLHLVEIIYKCNHIIYMRDICIYIYDTWLKDNNIIIKTNDTKGLKIISKNIPYVIQYDVNLKNSMMIFYKNIKYNISMKNIIKNILNDVEQSWNI